mgnify:CR=1 FL=1|jgi:hypothetical protein
MLARYFTDVTRTVSYDRKFNKVLFVDDADGLDDYNSLEWELFKGTIGYVLERISLIENRSVVVDDLLVDLNKLVEQYTKEAHELSKTLDLRLDSEDANALLKLLNVGIEGNDSKELLDFVECLVKLKNVKEEIDYISSLVKSYTARIEFLEKEISRLVMINVYELDLIKKDVDVFKFTKEDVEDYFKRVKEDNLDKFGFSLIVYRDFVNIYKSAGLLNLRERKVQRVINEEVGVDCQILNLVAQGLIVYGIDFCEEFTEVNVAGDLVKLGIDIDIRGFLREDYSYTKEQFDAICGLIDLYVERIIERK